MSNIPILGKLIKPDAPQLPQAPQIASPISDNLDVKKQTAAQMERAAAAQRKLSGSAATLLTSGGGAGLAERGKTSANVLLGI